MTDLQQFQNRYFDILQSNEPMRTNRLVNLMTDMEQVYEIPILKRAEFERANPEVMHLYRLVSKSRNLEEVTK
ncbi:hypothetical protein [Lentibacillus salicampi]|uniref:Uncharacterized protein n=1 Tax=Lentibacillus salicampi TaxID=175306 RepID=A0A4Y9AA21_9BACI|nr:hypothetical protein [Lentibacillus salicampi]TFJ92172.1 hypothetical protein E4U82_13925 [Lentibacillus salicampi]